MEATEKNDLVLLVSIHQNMVQVGVELFSDTIMCTDDSGVLVVAELNMEGIRC